MKISAWGKQGSDNRARTQKNPAKKNPAQNNEILMSYSTVIKKFFTRLKDVNV